MCHVAPALEHVLDEVSRHLPGLKGCVGQAACEQLCCGRAGNTDLIQTLFQHCQQQHPEAGRHYWSVRTWTLLIWQPIYLSVLAVHLQQCALRLNGMGQSTRDGFVGGYCLPDHTPRRDHLPQLIALSGAQLAQCLSAQLDEYSHLCPIAAKLARLLIADCLRAALLLLQRQQDLSTPHVQQLEHDWLAALELSGRSPLVCLELESGRQCLALGRSACCQHFRRADGEPCAGCPRLKPHEREQRLRQELIAQC